MEKLPKAIEFSETNAERGKPFWTLGFEAFNNKGRVENILIKVVQMELQENQCPKELYDYLTEENTNSYPAGLQNLNELRRRSYGLSKQISKIVWMPERKS